MSRPGRGMAGRRLARGNPLGGWLADRIGARRTLTGGLVLVAAAALGIALVAEPWHAFAATGLGLGAAIVWPSQDALLALR